MPALKTIFEADEENKIIRLKYAAPQIRMMTEWEIKKWAKALILKINIITGWIIPSNETMNILVDQFEKKLIEDYDMLNPEEIEYAFRKSGTVIKDWGKEMNLNLIDQVLGPYLDRRLQASATEEKTKHKPPQQKIYTDEEILNERRGKIEEAFQNIKKGYYPILHVYFGEVLKIDGLIQLGNLTPFGNDETQETVEEFFVRRLGDGSKNIYIVE